MIVICGTNNISWNVPWYFLHLEWMWEDEGMFYETLPVPYNNVMDMSCSWTLEIQNGCDIGLNLDIFLIKMRGMILLYHKTPRHYYLGPMTCVQKLMFGIITSKGPSIYENLLVHVVWRTDD